MGIKLSTEGRSWDELKTAMMHLRRDDVDWRHGRHGAYVWYVSEDLERVAREAYGMFMAENGLGPRAFPSLRQMEEEVVGITLSLLQGEDGAGQMTSGGTESVFLAAKAARDWARAQRPEITNPEVVAPFSAHPAINKAAHYLGLRVIRVPTGPDFRADVQAMSRAITPNTIMLYGSAPAYSLGVIDPIAEIGELAEKRGHWFHVDACVGGILGPFVRRLGYPVPIFDFSLPGVSSISADHHKSGYTAKGASTVLFRNSDLQKYSRYEFDDWPTGLYSNLTFTGTRPGGAIAAAWAVMNFLGEKGYLKIAETVMRARQRFEEGLTKISGFHVWGHPDLWAIAFGAEGYDILEVWKTMVARGWFLSPVRRPPGIHLMVTAVHELAIDECIAELKDAVARVREGQVTGSTAEARY